MTKITGWLGRYITLKRGDESIRIKDYELDRLDELKKRGFKIVEDKPKLDYLGRPWRPGCPEALD